MRNYRIPMTEDRVPVAGYSVPVRYQHGLQRDDIHDMQHGTIMKPGHRIMGLQNSFLNSSINSHDFISIWNFNCNSFFHTLLMIPLRNKPTYTVRHYLLKLLCLTDDPVLLLYGKHIKEMSTCEYPKTILL